MPPERLREQRREERHEQRREELRPAPPPTISDAVLQTTDLVKVHGQGSRAVTALGGITMDLERGRFTAIMGPSGSGKSTLLHCLAGLDSPTSGQVMLGPTDLTRMSERKLTRLRRDRIGFVFQSYDLLPQLTVRQNIVLPVEVAGGKLDRAWLDTVLEALDLGSVLRQLPAQLSGGQQQRVAVARAVLARPDVVLADEPTGALDAGTTREMLGFLRASVDHLGQTVVMVTHDPLAAQHTDRAVMLHDGRLAGEMQSPTAHGVLDALAALDTGPERADPERDRRGTPADSEAAPRGLSRWIKPSRRRARRA
jgi:putative ABC transport system ATP-binding protein